MIVVSMSWTNDTFRVALSCSFNTNILERMGHQLPPATLKNNLEADNNFQVYTQKQLD